MTKILIEVSPETAAAYQSAFSEEKERVRILIDLLMRKPDEDDSDFLGKLMDEISDEAEARGLTPEILESLLNLEVNYTSLNQLNHSEAFDRIDF